MFKLKFAKTYDNKVFEAYQLKPIVEDYFLADENKFCIADGVTRDTQNGEAVPYPKNQEEANHWIETYPNPSGAYQAAKICTEYFMRALKETKKESISKESMLDIVKNANKEIFKINENRIIDYLAEDYYGCVAVGGYIISNRLYCFSIGDCHILGLDEDGNIQFQTINNHKPFEEYLENIYAKEHVYDWNQAKDRVMIRKMYRNKPGIQYKGKDISFGVLTGEKEAEYYIDTYVVDVTNIKYICAFSDGCEPYFEKKETIQRLLKEPEAIREEGKERTLIIYEKEM